jgi:hypothetical protein
MTCIVAVTHNGRIVMGGDSCASTSRDWQNVSNPKVFHVGEFMLGCCGSFRMIDLLRYHFTPPECTGDPDRYIRAEFVDAVIECFQKGGWLHKTGNVVEGGNFLVGFRNRIFEIQTDFSVLAGADWGTSVGSGELAARGSLFTSRFDCDPEHRVHLALEAAEACVPSVRGPFLIERNF